MILLEMDCVCGCVCGVYVGVTQSLFPSLVLGPLWVGVVCHVSKAHILLYSMHFSVRSILGWC